MPEFCVTTCYLHVYPNRFITHSVPNDCPSILMRPPQSLRLLSASSAHSLSLSLFPSSMFWLKLMHQAMLAFAYPFSPLGAFYVVFSTPNIPSPPLPLPWQASVFWRLTVCGALTGSVVQRNPGESNPLFLHFSECSFKGLLLLESFTSTDISLSRETCNTFGTS